MPNQKYRNKKVECDDHIFDSTAEYIRYCQLKIMVRNKMITDLELQPKFPLMVNGHKITTYISDFRYVTLDSRGEKDREIIEDVKGMATREYVIKIKLAHALLGGEGYEFAEIPAADVKDWLMKVPDATPRGQTFGTKERRYPDKRSYNPKKKGKGSRNHPKKLKVISDF